jgi:hypothetical protein
MAKPRRRWVVTPHEPIEKLDDNLWTVQGNVPGAPVPRRMCIVRRSDGTLLFFHAIPLSENALAEVTAWGRPEDLVVGHHQHVIDADAFARRLGLRVYGPGAVAGKLRDHVDLTGPLESVKADPSIDIASVPGSRLGEAVVTVRSGGNARVSLLFSDVIQNGDPGRLPWFFRALGFAGGPKVVFAYRKLFVADRGAVKAALEGWSRLPGLTRLVPCHGRIISEGAAAALAEAAAAL